MYYADFLPSDKVDFLEKMSDGIGLDRISDIYWIFGDGTGWDCDPIEMRFVCRDRDDARNVVRVGVDLYSIGWSRKKSYITIDGEKLGITNRPEIAADYVEHALKMKKRRGIKNGNETGTCSA